MVYTYSEVRKQLPALLEKAVSNGLVKFRSKDGRVFVIRPESTTKKSSPFDVPSVKLPVTREEIMEAVRESRERE